MKTKLALIALLLVAAGPASATVVATMDNEAGGKIVLTDIRVDACKHGFAAYGTSPKSNTQWGCWVADETFVHITWFDDGNTRSYEGSDFTILETPPSA